MFTITREEFYKICDSIQPNKRGCLIWRGIDGKYRTNISVDGERAVAPSRLSLERKLGRPIGKWLLACHHCDVPRCVNQDHIYEGTHKQNSADCIARHPMFRKLRERRQSNRSL